MKTWPSAEEKQIVEGWQHDAHGWWWQNEDGSWVASDWRLIAHHHYLFRANGYIRTGWHRWNPDTKQVDPADGSETGIISRRTEIFRVLVGIAKLMERWKCGM